MASASPVALRFRRSELHEHARLSDAAIAVLDECAQPAEFVLALVEKQLTDDAVHALAMLLPHRQSVWWACLCARLLPDLEKRKPELAAVEAAEKWVQSQAPGDAEQAGKAASKADRAKAPAWVAQGANWCGPSLAPRGQPEVPPSPFLPGVATRSALTLLGFDPAFAKAVPLAQWLPIGLALMAGENGKEAQGKAKQGLA
jgi:hypothetical protein